LKAPVTKLRIPDDVAALVRNLHPHLKQKIRSALQAIVSDPRAGKALRDELSGLRSFRVSRFRIVYRISVGRKLEIVAIGPRDRIYQDTFLRIKREQAG
jgi:mRNA interferase RelE/StbE